MTTASRSSLFFIIIFFSSLKNSELANCDALIRRPTPNIAWKPYCRTSLILMNSDLRIFKPVLQVVARVLEEIGDRQWADSVSLWYVCRSSLLAHVTRSNMSFLRTRALHSSFANRLRNITPSGRKIRRVAVNVCERNAMIRHFDNAHFVSGNGSSRNGCWR